MSNGGTFDGLTSELHFGLAVYVASVLALSGRAAAGREGKVLAVLGRLGADSITSSSSEMFVA